MENKCEFLNAEEKAELARGRWEIFEDNNALYFQIGLTDILEQILRQEVVKVLLKVGVFTHIDVTTKMIAICQDCIARKTDILSFLVENYDYRPTFDVPQVKKLGFIQKIIQIFKFNQHK